ncbi:MULTISPECIES: sensor histidine kinase [unclassified Arthrobacter]|uniref:sensor histidine kinase n=1 Tax=unclassified Arthrobacter TaxID=235627 RepID=UPI0014918209|nr:MULTISPECIES: cofactor assembly of complex C subunit B [unclassified Arthrobacter]MBE0010100.1 cofactor assembly of complex C subunit B [Arthrobacter sp. AET 35A]NOJ63979.1 cofactor assembly of complex C subunit B [Arthrobacter sp. 147(2020)]
MKLSDARPRPVRQSVERVVGRDRTPGTVVALPEKFWDARPIPSFVKVFVILAALLSSASDLFLITQEQSSLTSAALPTLIWSTLGVCLLVWRSTFSAAVFIPAGFICIATGNTTYAALAFSIIGGFVAATAVQRFLVSYLAVFGVWCLLVAVAVPREVPFLIAYILLFAIGCTTGLYFRRAAARAERHQLDLQQREEHEQEAICAERQRIARELHDVVAHGLTIVAMHARVLNGTVTDAERRESQDVIGDAARQTLVDLRRMLQVLHGPDWDAARSEADDPAVTLEGQLQKVVGTMRSMGIAVTCDVPEQLQLPRSIELALIRITQESTTNILKHAGTSTSVSISITEGEDGVVLVVSNTPPRDARPMSLPGSGIGLVGMKERATLFGGTLFVGPDADGWTVRASLPHA